MKTMHTEFTLGEDHGVFDADGLRLDLGSVQLHKDDGLRPGMRVKVTLTIEPLPGDVIARAVARSGGAS